MQQFRLVASIQDKQHSPLFLKIFSIVILQATVLE